MKKDKEIIESLIAGGIVGAALGAILSNNTKGATIGAIAGAALLATYSANEKAKNSNIPLFIEVDGYLCKMMPDGDLIRIRKIERPQTKVNQHFLLK
jgi:hypothetical protein